VITLFLALASPTFGVLAACFFAWQLHGDGRIAMRNVMLGLATLALVPIIFGFPGWAFLLLRR
jgi:hypothetical protein